MGAVLNWGWVRVSGASMTPTLQDGDRLLVHYGGRVRAGAVVLGRFRSDPDLAVIKRVSEADPAGGWRLASDNSRAGTDSRTLGPAEVEAVAVRLWPTAPSRRRPSRLRRFVGLPIPPAAAGWSLSRADL